MVKMTKQQNFALAALADDLIDFEDQTSKLRNLVSDLRNNKDYNSNLDFIMELCSELNNNTEALTEFDLLCSALWNQVEENGATEVVEKFFQDH
jgi:hypothetical protein